MSSKRKTATKRKVPPAVGEVGYIFDKYFPGHGWFEGRVIAIRPGAKDGKDRRCRYEDGDEEDCTLAYLKGLPKKKVKKRRKAETPKKAASGGRKKMKKKHVVERTSSSGDDKKIPQVDDGTDGLHDVKRESFVGSIWHSLAETPSRVRKYLGLDG